MRKSDFRNFDPYRRADLCTMLGGYMRGQKSGRGKEAARVVSITGCRRLTD
jgi:hypothetical protein